MTLTVSIGERIGEDKARRIGLIMKTRAEPNPYVKKLRAELMLALKENARLRHAVKHMKSALAGGRNTRSDKKRAWCESRRAGGICRKCQQATVAGTAWCAEHREAVNRRAAELRAAKRTPCAKCGTPKPRGGKTGLCIRCVSAGRCHRERAALVARRTEARLRILAALAGGGMSGAELSRTLGTTYRVTLEDCAALAGDGQISLLRGAGWRLNTPPPPTKEKP